MLNSPADIDPISRHETQSATIHPAKEIKLQQLLEEAKSLPIIFDWGTKDFEDIIAIVNNLKAKKQADIVFIDHLQLLELGPDKDEYNTLRRITKSIKNYALRNNTPFIVLSQFSRPAKDKVFKEPTGHDLRSSGTISQDSDNILLLYKDPNTSDANELILKIDKWRSMVDRPPVYFTYTTGFKNNIPHVFRKSKEEINYKVTAKENKSPSQQDINSFFDPVAGF
jgi:replicative DNA helicase